MIKGIDYAGVDGNKPPRTDALKADGVRFAYVRGSYTYKGQALTDPTLSRDRDSLARAGVRVGAYMILGWGSPTPEEQARTFIGVCGPRRDGELPPALDLEADSAAAVGRTTDEALEWAHRAYDVLVAYYGLVVIYTSARVWEDVFGGKPSRMGAAPGWIKVPYVYKAGNPPHPETASTGPLDVQLVPEPWRVPSSAGVWIEQFQGDAKSSPGMSSTVDLNSFLAYRPGKGDARDPWVRAQCARSNVATVAELQLAHGLTQDQIVGPDTFVALAR